MRRVLLLPLQAVVDLLVWRIWHHQELHDDAAVSGTDAVRTCLRLFHGPRHPIELGKDHEARSRQGQALATCSDRQQRDATSRAVLEALHQLSSLRGSRSSVDADVAEAVPRQALLEQVRDLVQHKLMVGEDDGLLLATFENFQDVFLHRRQLRLRHLQEKRRYGAGSSAPIEHFCDSPKVVEAPVPCPEELGRDANPCPELHALHLAADLAHQLGVGHFDGDLLPPLGWELRENVLLESADHHRGRQEMIKLGGVPSTHDLVHSLSTKELLWPLHAVSCAEVFTPCRQPRQQCAQLRVQLIRGVPCWRA
mmetsp:Transcript_84855/g.263938  ORF Transcript_84855/g.263938 Transcript_84855/m.263938 type:complete len:310 (+) Transcript_84855:1897-2826(+)